MDVDLPSPNSSPQSVNTDFTETSESQPGGEHSELGAGEGLMAVGSDHPLGPDGGFHGHANPQQVDEPSSMDALQDLRFSESVNNHRPSDVESASVPARPDNFEAPQPDASSGAYLPEESLWFPDGESNIFDINDLATMFSPNMPLPTPGQHTSSIGFLGDQSEDFFFTAPHASLSMGFSEDEEYLHAVIATTDKTYNAANSPVVTDSEVSACVEMISLFSISKLPLSKIMIIVISKPMSNISTPTLQSYILPHLRLTMHQVSCLQSREGGFLLTTYEKVSLTLAMLTIGALYASEPDRASALHSMASECLEQVGIISHRCSTWRYLPITDRKAMGTT
jgi:hypothetical protein